MKFIDLLSRVAGSAGKMTPEELQLPVKMDGREIDVFVAVVYSRNGVYVELTRKEEL